MPASIAATNSAAWSMPAPSATSAGRWDPSLAFVMGGAILVGSFSFAAAGKRGRTFLGGVMQLPARRDIDARLIIGSVVFGIGWGLAGFCPGPALVAFGAGIDQAALFVAAMLAGMVIYDAAERLIHAPRRRAKA